MEKSWSYYFKNRYTGYFLYVLFYLLIMGILQGNVEVGYSGSFITELIGLIPKTLFIWLVCEWLFERFLYPKKLGWFAVFYLCLLVVFAFLQRLLDNYVLIEYVLKDWKKLPLLDSPAVVYNIFKYQFVITIPFSARLFLYWMAEQQRTHTIEAEKMQAELNFLRNQFHPHFIFNALNGLYAKIVSGSPDAGDILLKISSLLRFSLYEANFPQIALAKEMAFIEHYISLQQLRFGKQLELSITVDGVQPQHQIEPFLIMPFVENGFKYCVNPDDGTGWITIALQVKDDILTLKIENSMGQVPGNEPKQSSGGWGLAAVKKRLAMHYQQNHELKIVPSNDSFFVMLQLKLMPCN